MPEKYKHTESRRRYNMMTSFALVLELRKCQKSITKKRLTHLIVLATPSHKFKRL